MTMTASASETKLRADADSELANQTHPFKFTGSGAEYFRIWIVNLCLTMATLGIYSAWAKVRRLQYFDRNTQLDGAVFNFHGNPVAILKGRAVALVLLIAYHYAFGFSKSFGVGVIVVLFVTLPWMLRSALRFRLRNTSYRGVRFHFNGSLDGAYLNYTPLLALLILPAAITAVFPKNQALLGMTFLVLYMSWPVIHAAMKRYQQANIEYGNQHASYSASVFSLIKPYLLSLLLGVGIMVVLLMFLGAFTFTWTMMTQTAGKPPDANAGENVGIGAAIIFFVLFGYSLYVVAGPFVQMQVWNVVWNHTKFPDHTVRSDLEFWPYLRLQTVNLLLTLLTLGLYRPFAVVRSYQYRLSRMTLRGPSFDYVNQSADNEQIAASGDSSADFFGIDLSF